MLDDQDLSKGLSDDDKRYLEEFTQVEILGLTNTKIKALDKLPDLPDLRRVRNTIKVIIMRCID
jgi:hypothetical protein